MSSARVTTARRAESRAERSARSRRPALGRTAAVLVAGLAFATTAFALPPSPRASKRASSRRGAGYAHAVKNWHAPTEGGAAARDASGRPMLTLFSINTGDRVSIAAAGERGGFTAEDLDRAAHVLREPSTGNSHPLEPRLADVVYRIQTHFDAQEIRVISGYRTPHRRRASNHGRGRAIDLIVPGTSDREVAKFARDVGFCGVGIYPTSGFVHVDVRDRSYFWIDSSGPGRRNRTRGILGDVAKRSDEQAVARGERPLRPFEVASDVNAWLKARGQTPDGTPLEDDDDDETASE